MNILLRPGLWIVMLLATSAVQGADWTRFRGAGGLGVSDEVGLPVSWSSTENIVWQRELPGPGGSSPIVLGDRIYLTCYTGYGLKPSEGDQQDLLRHLLCMHRKRGTILWHKEFSPELPEHKYEGEGSYHGYSSSTPITDGRRLYVFLGKSGVFCFDLDGNPIWNVNVGSNINRWGSGCSPIFHKNLLIINASVESGALVAMDRESGEKVWRAEGIKDSWNTPLLVNLPNGSTELVVSVADRLLAFAPDSGEPLWNVEGVHRYVCPSAVAHKDIVYAIGGGHTSLAVRAGGEGEVTESHGLWRKNKGSNVSSPIYHDGHLYWASDDRGIVYCQDAATGEMVYEQRLEPGPGRIWASPVLADGKLYYPSQQSGTYVVAAKPEYELLSHNVFEDDNSRTNASPAVSNGQLFVRTDGKIYCIAKK